jgi:hypothetical protein
MKAGACMSDSDLADWEDPNKTHADGVAAIQQANETMRTTMSLMMDPKSNGAVQANLAVDTNEIPIGEGFKLLKKFHVMFGQGAALMGDVNELTKKANLFLHAQWRDRSCCGCPFRCHQHQTEEQIHSDGFSRTFSPTALPTRFAHFRVPGLLRGPGQTPPRWFPQSG